MSVLKHIGTSHGSPTYRKSEVKFIISPGRVLSKSDDQWHYIGYQQLIQLYGVDPRDCVRHTPQNALGHKDAIVLEPRYHGDYREYLARLMESVNES